MKALHVYQYVYTLDSVESRARRWAGDAHKLTVASRHVANSSDSQQNAGWPAVHMVVLVVLEGGVRQL